MDSEVSAHDHTALSLWVSIPPWESVAEEDFTYSGREAEAQARRDWHARAPPKDIIFMA